MPLYEYQCEKCGDLFEVMQKFSDEPVKVHEKCGGHVRRLLSAPALQFKGSGWYITDYAKGSNPPSGKAGAEASNNSDSGKSQSTKSEPGKSDGASTATPSTASSDKK
jgi:putative FmdB family regulatory protein